MTLAPPPYTGQSAFIEPVPPEFGEDLTPEYVQRFADAYDERDLILIQERLDALILAQAEGWTPTRSIESQLDHLCNVVSGYYVAKYLKDILSTLQEAEADLATWPAQREQRLADREREEAELAERRKAEAVLKERHAQFYAAMKQLNVSPPRWMDNQIANWSLA